MQPVSEKTEEDQLNHYGDYQALPFDSIAGHDKQLDIIGRAVRSAKVPHAYLFTGISGIGKRLVAIKLAQALQCETRDKRPCGRCKPCLKTLEGNHPDVITVEPEERLIKIEQIRTLQQRLGFKPFEGKSIVVIIDGADRMNAAAGNSLLKTVEEPPSSTHLILIAENFRQVLPTIVSRCQRLRFSPLSISDTRDILINKEGISSDEALSAALISNGSPGKAISSMEAFPPEERKRLLNNFNAIDGIEDIFDLAERLSTKENAKKILESLEIIKFFMRDMILFKMGMKDDIFINQKEISAIGTSASKQTVGGLLAGIESIANTERAILMNANKRLAIESMLINIFKESGTI